jgi:hypothetical protein
MAKKELTLKEHLRRIQKKGGKARWDSLSPNERSALGRKMVAARWAKAKKKATAKNAAAKKTRGPKKAS